MPTDPTHVRYVYKCRLCGEPFQKGCPAPRHVAMECLDKTISNIYGTSVGVPLLVKHECYNGINIGIADLQGARAKKPE